MNVFCMYLVILPPPGESKKSPSIGLIPGVLPEVWGHFWPRTHIQGCPPEMSGRELPPPVPMMKQKEVPHWYALRVTYGREKKAYDYLVEKNVEAFYPTIKTVTLIGGKRRKVEKSRLPNIFFARGTEKEIKSFVYDNANLPYLRFYYRHFHFSIGRLKEPLIVPDYQIENLKIICAAEQQGVLILPYDVQKFKTGQMVRIIEGDFKNFVGRVARFQGQQRVGITIEGLLTVATAYIPTAFIKPIE